MGTTTKEAIQSFSNSSGVASGYNSSINFVSPNKIRMTDFQESNNNYKTSFVQDEKFAQEVLSKAGPSITYQRKNHSHEVGPLGSSGYKDGSNNSNKKTVNSKLISESTSDINQDEDPIIISKPNAQNVVYKQQVNIRYLQPPTPPPPAPIIIREKQMSPPPRQPPIIIRYFE